jgi:hypothetical protein
MKHVQMSEAVYLAEHAHLVKLLDNASKSLKKEAEKQKKEVKEFLQKRRRRA